MTLITHPGPVSLLATFRGSGPRRFVGVAALAVTVTLLLAGATAVADGSVPTEPASVGHVDRTWQTPTSLPGAGPVDPAPVANSEVLSSPTGQEFLYYVTSYDANAETAIPTIAPISAAGVLGTPQYLPADPTHGRSFVSLGPVRFLSDGDAVFSWSPIGVGLSLSYRSAAGVFGPVLAVIGASDIAVEPGHLLIASLDGGVSVRSYTIAADATMAPSSGPVMLDTNDDQQVWAALDPDGSADVVVEGYSGTDDTEGMLEYYKPASGAWPTDGSNLSGSGIFTGYEVGAVAPGGREIVSWQTDQTTPVAVYAAVREPGGAFGSPIQVLSGSGKYVQMPSHAAAGADGTLALAVQQSLCASDNVSDSTTGAGFVAIAPPGSPLGAMTQVPGTANSTYSRPLISSLGADAGGAVVGVVVASSTNFPVGSCGSPSYTPGDSFTRADSAAVSEGSAWSTHTFGTTTFVSPSGGNTADQNLDVPSAGMNPAGDAFVIGSLSTVSSTQYDSYVGPISPAELTIHAASTTAAYHHAVALSGVLRIAGAPASGDAVALQDRPHGSGAWRPLAARTTNSTGLVRYSAEPSADTDYRWMFAGTANASAATSPVSTVTVVPVVTATLSKRTVRRGRKVALSGTVKPSEAGQRVALQRLVRHHWHKVRSATLKHTGRFSFAIKATKGISHYRVAISATALHAAAQSAERAVRGR